MRILALIINHQIKFLFSHQSKKKYFFKIQENQQKPQQKSILPSQYPKDLSDPTPVIRRGRPVVYTTPKDQIPEQKLVQQTQLILADKYNGKWSSPPNAYSLNIGLIGPVNSGKSQLLGKIIGRKISAVSPKSNTTVQTIQGFKSYQIQTQQQGLKNIQLKFYDTAGLMYKKTGFISKGWKVLSEIDFSLLVIDSTKRFDQMTKQSIRRLQMHRNYQNFMKALVLNKIDLVQNRRKFHTLISEIQKYGKFDKIFYVSATTGYGVDQLEKYLLKMSKKRDWQQPKQAITSLTQIQIYQQMMKQCLYHRAYKQVPYQIVIECLSTSLKSNNTQQIHFKFIVQNQNQQRMIIGTEGRNLKWIINRFKVYYTQTYKKQAQVHVDVRKKKKTNQTNFLSEQNIFDEETQKRFYKQKIAIVQDYLYNQGKFKKENMIQWNGFKEKEKEQIKNMLLEGQGENNTNKVTQVKGKGKKQSKRTIKKFPNILRKK